MKIIFLILLTGNAYAVGGVEIPYLIKILSENIKRYEQLKTVIEQGKDAEQLLRVLNEGIDNASGLLSSFSYAPHPILRTSGLCPYLQESLNSNEKNLSETYAPWNPPWPMPNSVPRDSLA